VNVGEVPAEGFKERLSRELIVDEYTVFARTRKLTSNDQFDRLAIIQLDTSAIEDRPYVLIFLQRKESFDPCGLLAFFDQIRGNTVTDHSPEAVHDDRFARARLAREQIQPRTEFDLELVDQRNVFDLKKREH